MQLKHSIPQKLVGLTGSCVARTIEISDAASGIPERLRYDGPESVGLA